MRAFEVAIHQRNADISMNEEKRFQPELGSEAYRKPDAIRLPLVGYAKPESWKIRSQCGTNEQWNLARQFGEHGYRLEIFCINKRFARPDNIALVFRLESDAVDIASIHLLIRQPFKAILLLLL